MYTSDYIFYLQASQVKVTKISPIRLSYLNFDELKALKDCGAGLLYDEISKQPKLLSALYKLEIYLSGFVICQDLRLICLQIISQIVGEVFKPQSKLVAVVDGDNSISLYREYTELDIFEEIDWPNGWADWVSIDFIRSEGYEIVIA